MIYCKSLVSFSVLLVCTIFFFCLLNAEVPHGPSSVFAGFCRALICSLGFYYFLSVNDSPVYISSLTPDPHLQLSLDLRVSCPPHLSPRSAAPIWSICLPMLVTYKYALSVEEWESFLDRRNPRQWMQVALLPYQSLHLPPRHFLRFHIYN